MPVPRYPGLRTEFSMALPSRCYAVRRLENGWRRVSGNTMPTGFLAASVARFPVGLQGRP